MSFSHSGDFRNFFLFVDIKISQDKGQGRTVPILTNSLDKGACFLQGGLPQKAAAGNNFLDNGANPGKIVIERSGGRPDPKLMNPVAQAFQPVLAQAQGS